MAMTIGEYFHINPTKVYEGYYPNQVISMFAYIVNRKHFEKLSYLDDKQRAKEPEVIVERILTKEEVERYRKQKAEKAVKFLDKTKRG